MFPAAIYQNRRTLLKQHLKTGVLLFLGNEESPMNYAGNTFPFRQDSTFLYYFGLDTPGLAAIIDIDNDAEVIYGYDFTMDDVVWMGPQPSLEERAESVGVKKTAPESDFSLAVATALSRGRKVHILPPYRAEHRIKYAALLHLHVEAVPFYVSEPFIQAVVAQRSIKSDEEITEIEYALEIAYQMHTFAIENSKPGMIERYISGAVEGIAGTRGAGISFPVIFSVHGETLHNHYHGNAMETGDLAVLDAGAESLRHYASDITRTIPIGGVFSNRQRDVYEIVLNAQMEAIMTMSSGMLYRDLHLQTAKNMADGLKGLGLMRGNIDDAVAAGAHALFFPHGLGHMMGLDVHDMENLGENYVGYDATVQRSEQFGLNALRLAKKLQPGFVLTVEPGIYFIPALIDQWQAEKKCAEFIAYDKLKSYRDFGGIRIEDDVHVMEDYCRVLGPLIPKAVAEIEALASD